MPDPAIDIAAAELLARLFPDARPNEGMTAWESTPEATKDALRTIVRQAPTLGDMADVMRDWQRRGVTRESAMYSFDQVWPL